MFLYNIRFIFFYSDYEIYIKWGRFQLMGWPFIFWDAYLIVNQSEFSV